MKSKVAINGFGRIGRLVFRRILENFDDIDIVAINDLMDPATLAHLLKYDSIHGRFQAEVTSEEGAIIVNNKKIKVFAERNAADLPWKELSVSTVLECSGFYRTRERASIHLEAGAERVIISAPSKDPDITVVMGVNHDKINKSHKIISNASCTTNCLAPVAKVLDDNYGIVRGLMTTIHAYTSDQRIQDAPHSDLRRARAAAMSMIPTTTGAAKAIAEVIPGLKGKMDGMAIRVPTSNVSLVDLTVEVKKSPDADEINRAMKKASEGELKGILGYTDLPLVSIDYNHVDYSSNFDALCTKVLGGNFVKILSWYDNEWGYSSRVVDLLRYCESL